MEALPAKVNGNTKIETMTPTTLGPYQVLTTIGRGGASVVYRARHKLIGNEVALKVLRSANASARLISEARAVAALRHPGLVVIHDCGQ